ncbi:phosphatase PAP2 family protein [Brevibacterium salitolerans]
MNGSGTRQVPEAGHSRCAMVLGAAGLLVVAAALGLWVYSAPGGETAVDHWWHDLAAGGGGAPLVGFSLVMDYVGAGWAGVLAVPLLIAAFLLWRRGWKAVVFALTACACSALVVQLAKHVVARARPEDMLVLSDFGSFPSGHTANAATVAAILWLLFPRMRVLVLGLLWIVLMAFSRTVLAVHWLTDTVGGAAVGIATALLCGVCLLPWAEPQGALRPEASSAPEPASGSGL